MVMICLIEKIMDLAWLIQESVTEKMIISQRD